MEKTKNIEEVKSMVIETILNNTNFTVNDIYEIVLNDLEEKVDKKILLSNYLFRIIITILKALEEEKILYLVDDYFFNIENNSKELQDMVKEKIRKKKRK